jgi:hypothetical protein
MVPPCGPAEQYLRRHRDGRVGLIGEQLSPQGLTKLLSLQLILEHLEAPFVALSL